MKQLLDQTASANAVHMARSGVEAFKVIQADWAASPWRWLRKASHSGFALVLVFCFVLGLATTRLLAAATAKIVRIGYQKSGALLLVKQDGSLEKKLASLGYGIEWREFPSGPPIVEALNAGALDVAHSGDAPLIFAQAAGVPFAYFGVSAISPESSGIVVPRDSPLKMLAELKGKRIAFAKGSSAHYLVALALEKAGLTFADIKPVYLQPSDARAALGSGAVDAWAVWDPFLAAAEIDAQARSLTAGMKLSPHREYYFGRREFVEGNPVLISALLEVLQVSGKQAMDDPKATAAFLAPKLGLSLAVMERSEARKQRYGGEPLSGQAVADQQAVADAFFKLGLIPKEIHVEDLVYHPTK